MAKAAVFLDRDDTLIENVPYLGDPTQVQLLPGAKEAITQLHRAGLLLIVVSNQSGVGRGLISKAQVGSVDAKMEELLGGKGIITAFTHCYAAPGDPYGERRKPSPLMLQEAALEHGLSLNNSFMVGNRLSDIQSGHAAGCRTIILELRIQPGDEKVCTELATFSAKDWPAASAWILQSKESSQ